MSVGGRLARGTVRVTQEYKTSTYHVTLKRNASASVSFHGNVVRGLRRSSSATLTFRLFMSKHFNTFAAGHLVRSRLRPFLEHYIRSMELLSPSGYHILPSPTLCCGNSDQGLRRCSTQFFSVPVGRGITILRHARHRANVSSPHRVTTRYSCSRALGDRCVVSSRKLRMRSDEAFCAISYRYALGNRNSVHPRGC